MNLQDFDFRIWDKLGKGNFLENTIPKEYNDRQAIGIYKYTDKQESIGTLWLTSTDKGVPTHLNLTQTQTAQEIELYTGYKDSKDIKIYENDIIEFKDEAQEPFRDIVIFDKEMGRFCTKGSQNALCYIKSLYNEVKVIGNIHEHPHLVPYKKQKNEDKEDKQ